MFSAQRCACFLSLFYCLMGFGLIALGSWQYYDYGGFGAGEPAWLMGTTHLILAVDVMQYKKRHPATKAQQKKPVLFLIGCCANVLVVIMRWLCSEYYEGSVVDFVFAGPDALSDYNKGPFRGWGSIESPGYTFFHFLGGLPIALLIVTWNYKVKASWLGWIIVFLRNFGIMTVSYPTYNFIKRIFFKPVANYHGFGFSSISRNDYFSYLAEWSTGVLCALIGGAFWSASCSCLIWSTRLRKKHLLNTSADVNIEIEAMEEHKDLIQSQTMMSNTWLDLISTMDRSRTWLANYICGGWMFVLASFGLVGWLVTFSVDLRTTDFPTAQPVTWLS